MKITIAAVGRMRAGPELELLSDYVQRSDIAGQQLLLGPVSIREIDDRKARDKAQQAQKLLESVPAGAFSVALDERGKMLTSPELAALLACKREEGCSQVAFLIGGPDGLDHSVRSSAGQLLSFGKMVWPHMLARVMLSEQIYRALSILNGSPYHRT